VKLRSLISFLVTFGLFTVLAPHTSNGTPLLQLDVLNGIYNKSDETTIAASKASTLYALLSPSKKDVNSNLNDIYYVSIALIRGKDSPSDFGSFTFNGLTYSSIDQFKYGTPVGLQPHKVFNTNFAEISFTFSELNKAIEYDVQKVASTNHPGPTASSSGTMYYTSFNFDTSSLASGYTIHFDLYNKVYNKNSSIYEAGKFAPFSHDASSTHAPIPGAIWLVGSGLIGILGFRKKFAR